ncbi:MAG: dihydroorotase [Acidobacteriota bacterium]
MRRILIAGGTVWEEAGPRRADVLLDGGRVEAVGRLAGECGEVEAIDATGCHVLPGLIDVHVHVADRIGAHSLADDVPLVTRCSVSGGVTTVATFVTQRSDESLGGGVTRMLDEVRRGAWSDVALHLTPTAWPWDLEDIERLVASGCRTFKLYTTYRPAGLFTDWERLETAMRALSRFGVRLFLHCEDDGVLGAVDTTCVDLTEPFSHSVLRPEQAEVAAIRRVVDLAERTGCAVHVVHVSTAEGVEAVAAARSRAPVTCETAPHYLLLDEERLRGATGHRWMCTPPLRAEATRARLEALVVGGAVDLLATDHCPFLTGDKDSRRGGDIRLIPGGLPGVGALLPLAFEILVRHGKRTLASIVHMLSANPARVLGIYPRKGTLAPGSDGDVVVLDVEGSERTLRSTYSTCHDPWSDRTTTLGIRAAIVGGNVTVVDGDLAPGATPVGRPLVRL